MQVNSRERALTEKCFHCKLSLISMLAVVKIDTITNQLNPNMGDSGIVSIPIPIKPLIPIPVC